MTDLLAKKQNGSSLRRGTSKRSRSADADHKHANVWLGYQIRSLRTALRLSLKEVAKRASVSIGMLSQLERGLSSPSIRSLRQISEALEVAPSYFFERGSPPPLEEVGRIVRAGTRRILHLTSGGVQKEMLTPDSPGSIQMTLVRLQPRGTSGPDAYTHSGEDAGVVLSGAMKLWVGDDRYTLNAGDSFRFKASLPHRFANAAAGITEVLWVVTPPFY
jgi:transcriptional regulator with XRE-family HTH domain